MIFQRNDGGRAAAGYKGHAGDCVVRAVAIASGHPYPEVYDALSAGTGSERKSTGRTARNGIHTNRKWFKEQMLAWGFEWTPTMQIGTGCRVHLTDGELPMGRLVVRVSKHLTAVIDSIIHDTHDPQRETIIFGPRIQLDSDGQKHNGILRVERRCVYGYWRLT